MKKLLALLLALTMVFALCACGQAAQPAASTPAEAASGDDAAPAKEAVTINVVTSYGGDDGNRKNFENAVAAYEESTGNKVNDGSATSNEEWKAKVLTDFETGSEPDVLFFFTNADAEPFITADKVVSIDEIRTEYPDYAANMKESMMATAVDGKHYAVPSAGFWENMFVNKTVLDACGVAVPGPDYTWDQFLADCQTILDNGYTPIACSLVEVPHYWFEFAVMNNGSIDDQLAVPTLDADGKLVDDAVSAKWIAALDDIKDLYERGFFPKNTLTAGDAETVALFGEDEAAFLIDGSWKVGYFTENHGDNLDGYAVSYVPAKGERKAHNGKRYTGVLHELLRRGPYDLFKFALHIAEPFADALEETKLLILFLDGIRVFGGSCGFRILLFFSHFCTHPFRKLLGLDMLGVLSAERAILTAFKTIGSILLILDRVVVSLLALVTSQGDFDSVVSHTFRHLLYYLSALRSGHLPPCMEQEILSGAKICARKKTSRPTGTDKYTILQT